MTVDARDEVEVRAEESTDPEKSPSAGGKSSLDLPPTVLPVDEVAERNSYDEDGFPEGGRGWIVVLGCSIFSAATVGWGYVALHNFRVWGVTEEYFRAHMFPNTSAAVLTTLGSIASLPFLAAGSLIWTASMIAAAFCTEVWQFFITMGIMQGIADALVLPIIVALPSQWFKRHRAFATSIVVAGSSIGGAVGSLVYRQLLSALGLRKALLIFAAIDALSYAAAYLMVEERRPAHKRPPLVWFDGAVLKDPVFWSVGGCFFFVVFGYLAPVFLVSTFTVEKVPDASALLAAMPVVVLNLSAAVGRTLVGFVADRFGPVNSLFLSVVLSGLSQLLVWMFVTSYAGIMVFATLYGLVCGCFLSLMSAVLARVYGADRLAGLSGLLLLFNAPGYAGGAPIAGAILGATGNNWRVVAGYGGSVQILGALALLYARLASEPRVFAVY
ncbi:major facilitator superfamily domain-containing protein [Trametes elegans]|nr:major facilitator superfamily domain-containing protein [Trametes elegans]